MALVNAAEQDTFMADECLSSHTHTHTNLGFVCVGMLSAGWCAWMETHPVVSDLKQRGTFFSLSRHTGSGNHLRWLISCLSNVHISTVACGSLCLVGLSWQNTLLQTRGLPATREN